MTDLTVIVATGEIQCPMKWSTIALEACIRYQDTRRGDRCREYACPLLEHRAFLQAEVEQMHTAPKRTSRPRRKRGKVAPKSKKESVKRPWMKSSTSSAESSSE